jgi:hypothetical protein
MEKKDESIFTGTWTLYDGSKRAKTATKKELKKNNKIAMDFIWEGLPKLVREKVGKCSSSKELWDKLHDIYSSRRMIQKIPKKMQIQNKKDAHHVRRIQKRKSMMKKKLITKKN